ncbi:MAG: type II toxin-antitoxin system HicB family antitoxin [Candidatus Magasanikbacteria bacterium]|nr:type II toxin-antitoxin system HicB family antitoxin [Candidatus Magasanikbacteria bacterium]
MYPVVIQEDENGGYWSTCPVFEGCYSQGETVDETLTNMKEAITLCLEERASVSARRTVQQVSLHFVGV